MTMKKLTGIKLINWHSFIDETIKVKNSVLITGENGAGKSTVLDAIQFVLTCTKNNFNKAANDASKRTLEGYVRYKTGKEERPFEREGDITSHVALEFYEENKKKYFIIGCVIDSASETSAKPMFYRLENIKIEDIKFKNEKGQPEDISEFKANKRQFKMQTFNTMQDGRKDFLNRLGRLSPKFLEILPKSLAFKPIKDVKDFVYSYILDEKEINVEALKENIRTFKEFQYLLDEVKKKINKLEYINEKFNHYDNFNNIIVMHKYIVLLGEKETIINDIENIKLSIDKLNIKMSTCEKSKIEMKATIDQREEYRNTLQQQLSSNNEYIALQKIESEINQKRLIKEEKDRQYSSFERILIKEKNRCIKIRDSKIEVPKINEFLSSIKNMDKLDIEKLKNISVELEKILRKKKDEYNDLKGRLKIELESEKDKLKNLNNKIKELEKRNLPYPKNVILLRDKIESEFKKIGKDIRPKMICELLEINDMKWKNAVEGYLNNQKFYLIVDKENFDFALSVYKKLRKEQKIHSVGLINTAKLKNYDEVDENSLAYVVESKHSDAKRFINMILGRVVRCEKIEELKKYKTAITSTCMLYKNHVARGLDPKTYTTPFIGKDAYRIQLNEAKIEKESLVAVINDKEELFKENKNNYILLDDLKFDSLIEKVDVINDLKKLQDEIHMLIREKEDLEKNNNFLAVNCKLQEIQLEINRLRKNVEDKSKEIHKCEYDIDGFHNKIAFKEKDLKEKEEELKKDVIEDIMIDANKRYEKERINKDPQDIKNNFTSSKLNHETKIRNTLIEIEDKQREYNSIYELGAAIGIDGRIRFIEELDYLKRSKIIEYEEQVKNAKENAEEEFKEHFMAKLKENIDNAKREFKELNKALKGIAFGNDEYEFSISESKEASIKRIYKMITSDMNAVEGPNLFSTVFQDKYKEELDELFSILTVDEEIGNKEIKKFTDYRTYMNYDIKIKHITGDTSLFSKVCREKSGGETQTPFYVAMAASFVQLYNQSHYSNEPIGLIMFDEAFSNMDDSRILSMMNFLGKLPLQLILASPPQKIDSITPHVNTTLLTMKYENTGLIEEWSHEKI